jgi:hypothetical protein
MRPLLQKKNVKIKLFNQNTTSPATTPTTSTNTITKGNHVLDAATAKERVLENFFFFLFLFFCFGVLRAGGELWLSNVMLLGAVSHFKLKGRIPGAVVSP